MRCLSTIMYILFGALAIAQPYELTVSDSSDYDPHFIKSLRANLPGGNVRLDGPRLILNKKDTAYFPEYPLIGHRYQLTAKKSELAVALTITRINQTTIDYKIEMVEFGNANHKATGQASLGMDFIEGTSSDISDFSKKPYISFQFMDEKDGCYTYIRIGKETGRQELLGKLVKNCNGKLRDIAISDFPSLMEKNHSPPKR